jgi:uncharacterized protein YecT (DUF1311 family)
MTDAELSAAYDAAERTERDVRRHLAMEVGAFEQARGMAAYRHAVALRKALEAWIATRSRLQKSA